MATKTGEQLVVGDVVANLWTAQGPALITKIEPYSGPNASFIVGIATFVPGGRVALSRECAWEMQS